MKISDPKGSWFVNQGRFPYHDPESNTTFEPGVKTKATATEWLKGQPVIQPTEVEEAISTVVASAPAKAIKEPKAQKA